MICILDADWQWRHVSVKDRPSTIVMERLIKRCVIVHCCVHVLPCNLNQSSSLINALALPRVGQSFDLTLALRNQNIEKMVARFGLQFIGTSW